MMCIHIYIYVYIYTYIYVYFSSQCGEVISKCNIKPYIEKINKSEQFKEASFVKNQMATCQHFFRNIRPKMILGKIHRPQRLFIKHKIKKVLISISILVS